MPREENGPVPHQEEFGSGQPKLVDVYRPSDESLIRQQVELMMSRFEDQANVLNQRLTRLEHEARQPRLAMEADGPANTKTRERTEGAATEVQAIHGDSCTTAQKVQDGPKTSISFGVKAEPPDLSCRDDVLVEGGDATPTSRLPSLKMRTTTAAGGLVPTGKISTATETTSYESLLRFYATEEMNPKENHSWTSIPSTWYDSSFWKLLAAPYCQRVAETKSMQNGTFDPGGSQGYPRACPFLGS